MKRKDFLRLVGAGLPLSLAGMPAWVAVSAHPEQEKERFTFAFFTDVHLQMGNGKGSEEALLQALEDARRRKVDFVLFGGDNIDTDRLGKEDEQEANTRHAHFRKLTNDSGLTCHFTIGNHDRYYYCNGENDPTGYKLFEKHMGPSRRSFTHKGVHFILLNSLNPDKEGNYSVGTEQMAWLKEDLEAVGKEMPIVVAMHVPMLSLYYPVVEGNFKGLDMVSDTKALFELLKEYNLQLVLQGHQHIHEELRERNHWFVTGGAICASWWNGPLVDTQEGYLLVHVSANNRLSWEYIDYQWEPKA